MLGPSEGNPDDLAAILYTSGSTGRPKGVMLSHANMWLGAVSVAAYLGMEADDVVLGVLPLSFDYGQNQLLNAWYAGASVVPFDYLFARDVVKACAAHGVTTLAAVPPLWVQLTEIDWSEDAAAGMRRLTNSGGALTVQLVDDLRGIFPSARLFPMYGLTEAFRSTYLDPDLVDAHPTSMGTAIPFAEILVIDDEGEVAGPDAEGELVHCGPLVAQGYWQDAERTAERFKPAPAMSKYGGTAVWSGDRVMRDAGGLLHFVGRRDAMIKSAGNRISPQEVEEAALATGLVAEAVALGVKDERLGQAVHLVVRAEPRFAGCRGAAAQASGKGIAQLHAASGNPLARDDAAQSERKAGQDRACTGDRGMSVKPKPLGPIPAGYDAIDGELAIGGKPASTLVEEAGGTPLFVYSADRLAARVKLLTRSHAGAAGHQLRDQGQSLRAVAEIHGAIGRWLRHRIRR